MCYAPGIPKGISGISRIQKEKVRFRLFSSPTDDVVLSTAGIVTAHKSRTVCWAPGRNGYCGSGQLEDRYQRPTRVHYRPSRLS